MKEQHLQRTEEHMCLLTSVDAEAQMGPGGSGGSGAETGK